MCRGQRVGSADTAIVMTHLTPQQFIEAMDDALGPGGRHHLQACDGCRRDLAELRALMSDVRATAMPEPSPLFWDHFSERVRKTASVQAIPAKSWWHGMTSPLATIGLVVAAVALVVVIQTEPVAPGVETRMADEQATGPIEQSGTGADDDALTFVAQVAANVRIEDLRQTTQPTADAADAAVEELTAQQRAALVRLLETKMGGAE
jgi:hypothetical protein